MQISDLATSAGINILFAAIFLLLYSIFRKQHGNAGVYFTKHLLRESNAGNQDEDFHFDSLLPSVSWVKQAWQPSEEEILASCGLDSVVFLRIFVFSLRFFGICTVIGLFVLMPLNFTDNQLEEDHGDILFAAIDAFSISNVKSGAGRLWVHFAAVYAISFAAYILLYLEYKHVAEQRHTFLAAARPQPDQFSVLVRAVPRVDDKTFSDTVEEFFTRYHPSTYLSHQMVYHAGRVEAMLAELKKVVKSIDELKKKPPSERPKRREGVLGLFGQKVDAAEIETRRLDRLHTQIRESQTSFLQKKQELPVAFVTFKSRWGAAVAAQTQQSMNPLLWVTEWAPEPRDVLWSNLSIPYLHLGIRSILVWTAVILLIMFYAGPAAFVQGLAELKNLQTWFPGLVDALLLIPGLSQVVTGYLPSLFLSIFLYLVPPFLLFLSNLQGPVSYSRQVRMTVNRFFYLLLVNVFFATVLSGTVFHQLFDNWLSNPKLIPERLAYAIPGQATFYITYILTTGWAGFPLEILQSGVLFFNFLKRHTIDRDKPYVADAAPVAYHRAIPYTLLFIFIGLMYTPVAPLLLPFLMVYFLLGFIVYRNQILNVYEPSYETGGQCWPLIHGHIILGLFLMQITMIGIFGIKDLPKASSACVPLPILTLLFNQHCKQRFLPVFETYAMEMAMNKDKEDDEQGLKDSMIASVHNAYRHPSLQPILASESESSSYIESLLPPGSESYQP